MDQHIYCVIMADGSGTPDQLRMTYDRFSRFIPKDHILVITLERYAKTAREVLPFLPEENLLVEPQARKTAPCMAYAAYSLLVRDPEAVIVASPWDLYIRDESLFAQTIMDACRYVADNDPKTPDVNFGYIQVREGRNAHLMAGPLQVKTFTEKPSAELAEVFVRTGEFFWNSGIFIWKAATIVAEMEQYLPEVTELFKGWQEHIGERSFVERAYAECPKVSLDNGVMEHTSRAWLYPARFGWADIERL